jgi:hypothetical protein
MEKQIERSQQRRKKMKSKLDAGMRTRTEQIPRIDKETDCPAQAKVEIGYADEVNGSGAALAAVSNEAQIELEKIAEYWLSRRLDNGAFRYHFGNTGSTEVRENAIAERRLATLYRLLGEDTYRQVTCRVDVQMTSIYGQDRWGEFRRKARIFKSGNSIFRLTPLATTGQDLPETSARESSGARAGQLVWRECWSMHSLLYAYTHQDAVDNGEFIDVSAAAQAVGIHHAVAITRAAWEALADAEIEPDEGTLVECDKIPAMLSELEPLVATAPADWAEIGFDIALREKAGHDRRVSLKAQCYRTAEAEPLVAILLVEEDIADVLR